MVGMARANTKNGKHMKRAFVSLPDGVWEVIHHQLKGKLGEGDSEIIRNIAISYLSEKGYLINGSEGEDAAGIQERLNLLAYMMASVVELLAEKGGITISEVDKRMKKKIERDNP
jgi:metal-responsive CopG/Arc/MetJ family transcriptional regulator